MRLCARGALSGSFHQLPTRADLEEVGADSGALRLIPGSHHEPLHGELRELGVGQVAA